MKRILILAIVMATAALPGCVVRGRSGGSVSVGTEVHTHTDVCGHYSHKGKWHHSEGHRHGHNCGHHYNSGIWIVLD